MYFIVWLFLLLSCLLSLKLSINKKLRNFNEIIIVVQKLHLIYVTSSMVMKRNRIIIIPGPGFRGGEAGLGGTGLTFAQNGHHFLAGIMSIKFKETIQILTDVNKHIPWLRNIYSIYNQFGKW